MHHYHVYENNPGCLPTGEWPFTSVSREEAVAHLNEEANAYEDAGCDVDRTSSETVIIDGHRNLYIEACEDGSCQIWAEIREEIA